MTPAARLANLGLHLVHLDVDDNTIREWPMGSDLHEVVLKYGETLMLRDSNDRDYLVVLSAR